MELKGAVAIVTGAARGLGKSMAEALLAAGVQVALVDVLADELAQTGSALRERGGKITTIATDVTVPSQVEAMAAEVEQELGPVDILINNAGTFSVIGPVWEADPELWFRDIKVNLYGSFLVCRAVVKGMVERRRGTVINMVSSGGVLDPHPYGTSYAASKTGLMRLTEGLAKEAEEYGIKVYAVGPPAVMTNMTRFILDDPGGRKWRPNFKEIFEQGNDHPPEVVTRLILALLSGKADRLSGRYFLPHGDWEAVMARDTEIVEKDLWTLRIRQEN